MSGITAKALLLEIERGERDLGCPVWVTPDRAPQPLRIYLRDLVWMSYQESGGAASSDSGTPDLGPYRAAFADAPVGMVLADLGGRVLHVNQAFATMLECTPDSLVGQLVGDISTPEDRGQEIRLGNALFRGERQRFQIVKRFKAATGDAIPCLVAVSLVRGADGAPQLTVATVVDHREQIELASLRARVERSDMLQRLARGVAHDFNNVLMAIRNSVFVIQEEDEDIAGTDAEPMDAIVHAISVGQQLTAQLGALSEAGGGPPRRINICAEVRARAPFLQSLLYTERQLDVVTPAQPLFAFLDASAIDQLLLNLVVNARNATEEGGRIIVRVSAESKHVVLSVQDNGRGMPEEVQARIMEPYFSRTPGGKGLGLAIVSVVLARVSGKFEVESREGEGTTMSVRFPLVA